MKEILIAGVILAVAGYFIFKSLRKSSNGECNCGGCSSSRPKYEEDHGLKIKK